MRMKNGRNKTEPPRGGTVLADGTRKRRGPSPDFLPGAVKAKIRFLFYKQKKRVSQPGMRPRRYGGIPGRPRPGNPDFFLSKLCRIYLIFLACIYSCMAWTESGL